MTSASGDVTTLLRKPQSAAATALAQFQELRRTKSFYRKYFSPPPLPPNPLELSYCCSSSSEEGVSPPTETSLSQHYPSYLDSVNTLTPVYVFYVSPYLDLPPLPTPHPRLLFLLLGFFFLSVPFLNHPPFFFVLPLFSAVLLSISTPPSFFTTTQTLEHHIRPLIQQIST